MLIHGLDDQTDLRRGRVDASLLPQEVALWQFTENLKSRHPTWRLTERSFLRTLNVSPCTWKGTICDENQIVRILSWCYLPHYTMEGNLSWVHLPRTVRSVTAADQKLRGGIDLAFLPSELQSLDVRKNHLDGPIVLSSLPPDMEELNLSENQFDGTIDLSALPINMKFLDLSSNLLIGKIELTEVLPKTLRRLSLQDNRFFGTVDLRWMHERNSGDLSKYGQYPRRAKIRRGSRQDPRILKVYLGNNNFTEHVPSGDVPRGVLF